MIISLNGDWQFKLDPDQSFHHSLNPDHCETIRVPGSWEEQGFGRTADHAPIGTWKKHKEYEGSAWYVKKINMPDYKPGKRIMLALKGVRWSTEVSVDNVIIGARDSLSAVHEYDITQYVESGAEHCLVIKVDNTMKLPMQESHIHSYHTATYWGGITGGAEIFIEEDVTIEQLTIAADTADRSLAVNMKIMNGMDAVSKAVKVTVRKKDGSEAAVQQRACDETGHCHMRLELGEDIELWSPERPYLYKIDIAFLTTEKSVELTSFSYGLRTFETQGSSFMLNGIPVFLNGYVDCCVFPQTGYPVWDMEHYKMQFQTAKRYGFNHVRLHGWTPPEPFWEAADEEGMLVQTELPHWSRHYLDRQQKPPEHVGKFLKEELKAILAKLHRHPSFVMFSMGNELISEEGHAQLNELVREGKRLDSTRLFTDNTGFGHLPAQDREGDYFTPTLNWHPPYNIDHSGSPDTTEDFREITRLEEKPLIAHEHGQFTMYVRPQEENQYTGVLQPHWLNEINRTIRNKNIKNRLPVFQKKTGEHLVQALKENMEKARRTPGLSGIQLLDIRDFPGQGHATVGILDVFWQPKEIVTPEAFRAFNSQTVLLMRSRTRTFFNHETVEVAIELSHFGEKIKNGRLHTYFISEKGTVTEEQTLSLEDIPTAGVTAIARLKASLSSETAEKWTLKAAFSSSNAESANQWDFWTFPRPAHNQQVTNVWYSIPQLRSALYGARLGRTIGIHEHSYKQEHGVELAIATELSRDVLQFVMDGGSAWLMAERGNQYDEVDMRYLPIFWNYMWFPQQTGTTMGLIIHQHPFLQQFPNSCASEWHWYHLVDKSIALSLDQLPSVEPIVEVIDNFYRAKRLAAAFEVRVGRGKLFVSTFRLADNKRIKKPEVQTMIHQTVQYLLSSRFQPAAHISIGELLGLFKVRSLIKLDFD